MPQLNEIIITQLSRMICGDDFDYLPYRTAAQLTDFFSITWWTTLIMELVDEDWVRFVLTQSNEETALEYGYPSSEMIVIIENLLNHTHFLNLSEPKKK